MNELDLMLARHAVELADCPTEHALAVARAHYEESCNIANVQIIVLRRRLQMAEERARLGGWTWN